MAGFHLSSAQYDALTAMYPSPIVDKPVCWKAFVDEVNLVFSKPNLEEPPGGGGPCPGFSPRPRAIHHQI